MTRLPFYCSHCNTLDSANSFINIVNSTNITFKSNRSTCTNCGELADGLEGTFNFYEGMIEVVQSNNLTKQQLKSLGLLLEKAVAQEINTQELEECLDEISPSISQVIKKFYPKNATELIGYFNILIRFIAILLGATNGTPLINIDIDNSTTIHEINIIQPQEETINLHNVHQPTPIPFTQVNKIGRNEPCYCGSELKYKKCCLNKF